MAVKCSFPCFNEVSIKATSAPCEAAILAYRTKSITKRELEGNRASHGTYSSNATTASTDDDQVIHELLSSSSQHAFLCLLLSSLVTTLSSDKVKIKHDRKQ